MKTLSVAFSALALFAACAADLETSPDSDLGKADSLAPSDDMIVFRNLITCFTAPCPVFTVVDPLGGIHQVADVVLPKTSDADDAALHGSGLAVDADIVSGTWNPGDAGDVLVVNAVLGHVATASPLAVGYEWAVVGADGARAIVSDIDLSALDLPADAVADMRADMRDGKLLVGGYVRSRPAKLGGETRKFIVTGRAQLNSEFTVKSSGIVCVTAPCPSLELTDADGNTQLVDDINFAGLGLSDDEISDVFENLFSSGIKLRGFVGEGDPLFGTALQVTKLL